MYNKKYKSIFELCTPDLMEEVIKMDKVMNVNLSGMSTKVTEHSIDLQFTYVPNRDLSKKYNIHHMTLDYNEWKKWIRIQKLNQI